MSFPALASTDDAAWLVAYRTDAHRTRVVLYRASVDDHVFRPERVLAARAFGVEHFCPGWLDCFPEEGEASKPKSEQFYPGDYIGLAGAKGRVVAAYVLPREGGRHLSKPAALYVSIVDEAPDRAR